MRVRAIPLLVGFGLTACVVGAERRPSRVESQTTPPPPAERRSAADPLAGAQPPPPEPPPGDPPSADAVWVSGYWHWDGVRHVWIAGRWEERPALAR